MERGGLDIPNDGAGRFLEQAASGDADGLPAEKVAVLERYLAIEGNPDAALAGLRALAGDAGRVMSVDIAADGTLASGEWGRTYKLWAAL